MRPMTPAQILDVFAHGSRSRGTYVPYLDGRGDSLPIVNIADVDRLIAVAGLREPFFALSNARSGIDPFNSWRFHDPVGGCADPRVLLQEALRGGTTLIMRHTHMLIPAVRALVLALQREQDSLSVQANFYITPPHSQGVPVHADPRDTLLLQQHGSKRWQIWSSLAAEDSLAVTLHPGDGLFIPAGCLHHSGTEESHSMHLTLGLLDRSLMDDTSSSLSRSDQILRIV